MPPDDEVTGLPYDRVRSRFHAAIKRRGLGFPVFQKPFSVAVAQW